MAVKRLIVEREGLFFITITCSEWRHLFSISGSYDVVYKWFNHLKEQGHFINGYVIMPNHLHALIAFRRSNKSINTIIGNGKRFMAYELVSRLAGDRALLHELEVSVSARDRKKGSLHAVFEPSFDWKECRRRKFIEQKLNYIHENPCRGKWNLVHSPHEYLHSSAWFYATGVQGIFPVVSYTELEHIDLSRESEKNERTRGPEAETPL